MAAPVQTFDRTLEPLSGNPLNQEGDGLVNYGVFDSAVTTDPVYAGRIVHVHTVTAGTDYQDPTMYRPTKGFRPGALGNQFPFILIRGSDNQDTQGVTDASYGGYSSLSPGVKLVSGIACKEPLEVATREFDSALTYAVNEPLKSVRSDSAANAGTLTNASVTVGTNQVHGWVSGGKTNNNNFKTVLHFWTDFVRGSEAMS